jgi:hypothetical protein
MKGVGAVLGAIGKLSTQRNKRITEMKIVTAGAAIMADGVPAAAATAVPAARGLGRNKGIRSTNRSHLALAGAAILVIVLSACGSAAPPGATGTVRPTSPTIGPSSPTAGPIRPTIGPSIPANGPFGAWWNKASSNGTEGGGLLASDNRANDLRYIAQDEASGDDAALSSDGTNLARDMTQAEADPPPYDASDYQQAMSDYIKAGDDYGNGDITAGDAELQIANTMFARWGRTAQPYCPNGGDCIDDRSFASATPSP